MANVAKWGFVLAVFALATALFLPTLITSTQTTDTQSFDLQEGGVGNVTDYLAVEALNVSSSNSNATLEAVDREDFDSNNTAIDVGNTSTVTLDGEDVTLGVESVDDTDSVVFNATYPPMYGFNDGVRTFYQNWEGLVVIIGAMLLIGGAKAT